MRVSYFIIALGLMFLCQATPACSEILSPAESSGVELHIQLGWTSAAVTGGDPNGIYADIILQPGQIIVSRHGQTPEAHDAARGCAGIRPRVGPDGKLLLSDSDAEKFINCERRAITANTTLTHHAVILPIVAAPRKCTETRLSNGSYRICAALVEQEADRLRMEYEEDTDYAGKLYAYRARFDITLLRHPLDRLRRIWRCNAKIVEAFTFNPKQPSKLTPFDRITSERCWILAADIG
jgi:hypothetical protein